MGVVGVLLYLLLIAPVRVGIVVSFAQGSAPSGMLGVLVWGVGTQVDFAVARDDQGVLNLKFQTANGNKSGESDLSKTIASIARVIKSLRIANISRSVFKASIHLKALQARAVVGLADAAQTALLTGLLQVLAAKWGTRPGVRLRVDANFRGGSALYTRCIVHMRLGNILLACLLGLSAYLKAGTKEEQPWSITPSNT